MKYTLRQIASLVGGELVGSSSEVSKVIIDSRESGVDSACLFVALKGVGRDGFDYIEDAYKAGIRAFLVDRLPERADELGSFVVVSDTLCALQSLAKAHRESFGGKVVAITGSNGKTTVKEWFSQLWDNRCGKLFRSPRSYNSQIGVALSLLMIEGDESVAIIEAGISQCGEMARLQAMLQPDFGVLTNIGDAHAENFESREQKFLEKIKLFEGLSDDKIIRGDRLAGQDATLHNLCLVGELYKLLGVEPIGDKKVQPLSLRLEVQKGVLGSLVINDSYSNDMVSLGAALDFAQREAAGRSLNLVITDIEQSAKSDGELYADLRREVEKYSVSKVVAIGEKISAQREVFEGMNISFFGSVEDYLGVFRAEEFAHSAVLIKGARSFRAERISARLEERTHTTTLEVNLSKIVENFKHYESLSKDSKIMAMVKASSYGLGALQISRSLVEAGVYSLAVAYADEGIALRRGGITAPVWVMNSDPGSFGVMIENNLEPEIYSVSSLCGFISEVNKAGASGVAVHIKLDTGMHRLGFMDGDIDELCEVLCREGKSVRVATIFTHLAAADDPCEDDFTRSQIALFDRLSQRIIEKIGYTPMLSIANSAGSERFPEARRDIMRVGIGLYANTSTLKCKITQIKKITKGETVGYNRREKVDRDMTIAIIPIGYADGLSRKLGCRVGQVMAGGKLCDIIGNVCMDTTIIDVTEVGDLLCSGDSVVVFGEGGLSESDVAERIGTISYEVLTSISPRIKRLYIW